MPRHFDLTGDTSLGLTEPAELHVENGDVVSLRFASGSLRFRAEFEAALQTIIRQAEFHPAELPLAPAPAQQLVRVLLGAGLLREQLRRGCFGGKGRDIVDV